MQQPIPRAGRRWITGMLMVMGAATLFSAGIFVGRQQATPDPADKRSPAIDGASPNAKVRTVFSPRIISDPYFLAEQRKVVEALERSCKFQHQNCEMARKAAAALDALE